MIKGYRMSMDIKEMVKNTKIFKKGVDVYRLETEYNGVPYSATVYPAKDEPILVQNIRVIGVKGDDIIPNVDDWSSIMIANLQRFLVQMFTLKVQEVKAQFGSWEENSAE